MNLTGDCLEILPTLDAESVQCCVTSPPYYGLRDYGTATWEGGDPGCDHKQEHQRERDFANRRGETKENGYAGSSCTSWSTRDVTVKPGNRCRKCGAVHTDNQIGLESTPEAYVEKLVAVFREVRRVLRDDGTVWLNLGDSYASIGHKKSNSGYGTTGLAGGIAQEHSILRHENNGPGLKHKDLIGIPWRVAFALQADGWWLRQDIIWAKPNPMPESVTDRCTKSHEYIFLLTKSARYFYDQEAVKEAAEYRIPNSPDKIASPYGQGFTRRALKAETSPRHDGNQWNECNGRGFNPSSLGRNSRSVWTITTKPFKSVFSYGKYRIASPDCPVHDYPADLEHVLECDALLASSQLDRMMNNGIHPFPLREGVVVSIPLDHPSFPFDGTSAIPHSMRNYKTEDELRRDEIFFGISPYRIEYKELIDHSISKCVHTRGNNTEVDVFQGVSGTYPSGQTQYRIFCILTSQSPPSGCLCHYTGSLKKGQDHFAVFPPEIPEICIRAGTSEKGCCPECGSPWVRVVNVIDHIGHKPRLDEKHFKCAPGPHGSNTREYNGWRPTCTHNLDPVPCTVLDPFSGAGTTGNVAERLGRKYIGIELNPAYQEMAEKRIEAVRLPLFQEAL